MISFTINGKPVSVDDDPSTPLLWVIRDSAAAHRHEIWLRHGAMWSLHRPHRRRRRSVLCSAPLAGAGKNVTTIEGISPDFPHPLQQAWIEVDVPQCGYCQSGQIMSAAVLLAENPNPPTKTSTKPCPATFAAAAPTLASAARFTAPLKFRPMARARRLAASDRRLQK